MPPKKDNDNNNSSLNNGSNNNNNSTTTPKPLSNVEIAAAEQKQALYCANAKLCRLVKRCPWMYDRQHPNYAKKHIMDKSWAKIAKDCDDSVASCKERWRNVRAAFARSINIYKTTSGPNRVKPYYLYNELQFLIKPMMDGRDMSSKDIDEIKSDWEDTTATQSMQPDAGDVSPPQAPSEAQLDVSMSDDEADLSFADDEISLIDDAVNTKSIEQQNDTNCTSTSANVMPTATNSKQINECQTSGYRSFEPAESTPFQAKRPKLFHDLSGDFTNSNDPDAKFLEALLPDMRAMNTRQKIIFKRKIYQSLEEVFETSTDFPAQNARHQSAMGVFQTWAPGNQPNVTHSIASLKENEMKKLQEFLQNILRQRTTTTAEMGGSTSRHVNGQPVTIIPARRSQRHSSHNNTNNNSSNNNNHTGCNIIQPIPLKYELLEDEEDETR